MDIINETAKGAAGCFLQYYGVWKKYRQQNIAKQNIASLELNTAIEINTIYFIEQRLFKLNSISGNLIFDLLLYDAVKYPK